MSTRRRSTSRARTKDEELVISSPTKRSAKKAVASPPKPRRSSSRSTKKADSDGGEEEEEEEEEEEGEQPQSKPTKRGTKKAQNEEIIQSSATKSLASPAKAVTASSRQLRSATKDDLPPVSPPGADHDGSSRLKSFLRRLWAGSAFFAVFCTGIHLGHPVLIPFIFIIQLLMYNELVDLSYSHLLEQKHVQHIPLFRTQNWFWFCVATFYSYSRVLQVYTKIEVPYYLFISCSAFFAGFMWFVLTLRKDLYRVQFGMLAWTWLSLLIFMIAETAATVSIMFQGLIWLVLPAILIMTNDTWAYIWGLLFGKHSLIELSAKKTWEGFIGALISTPIQGFLMARWMAPYPILTCPQTVFPTFAHPVCEISPLFQFVPVYLPFTVPVLGWDHILVAPIQYHAIILSLFAGFVAPFGGFFASGFKRAFGIKDFGSFIPGHGGFTDRMDCQLIMGIFVYAYYYSFVQYSASPDCAALLADAVIRNVTPQSLATLYKGLDAAGQAAFKSLIK